MKKKIIQALLHTLLDSYGNDKVYHPDGTTFEVEDLLARYVRVNPPTGKALELEQSESTFDSVAHEFLAEIGDTQLDDVYYEFRKLLQRRIQQQFPTTKFGNF